MSSTPAEINIEDALKELKYVSWTNLLNALGIDRTLEVKLFEAHRGKRDGSEAMREVLHHWMSNYDSSWKELAIALMKIRQYVRNGAYVYNKYVNPECFTPEKISEELSFIEDWFEVAHPFLDNSNRIREAIANATTDEEKRVSVFRTWIDTFDLPSWEEVVKVIEDVFPDHVEAGRNIRKKYLPEVKLMPIKSDLSELRPLDQRTLFEETSDVQDWYSLGWFLGITEEELLEIEAEIPAQKTGLRREEVLKLWMRNKGDKANWLTLGEAICKMRSNLGMGRRLVKRAKKAKEAEIQPDETLLETDNTIKFELTAANIIKEIGPMPWKVLRIVLEIDQSVQDQLEADYSGSAGNQEFTYLVLQYWINHRQSTWEALALALMKPQTVALGAYIYNKYVNPQSFSFNEVSKVLSTFDILQLSYSLFNDPEKFRKIIKSSQMATRTGIVNYWLMFGHQPSWEKVATAIDYCLPDKSDLAKSIRSKYLPEVTEKDMENTLKILPLKNLEAVDLQSALEVTKDVKDWYGLGWFLGMNDKELTNVEDQTITDDNKKQLVLEQWLKTSTSVSWKTLAEAMRKMPQHHQLSQQILLSQKGDDILVPSTSLSTIETEEMPDMTVGTIEISDPEYNFKDVIEDLTDDFGAIQQAVKKIVKDSSNDSIDRADVTESVKRVDSTLTEFRAKLEDLKEWRPTPRGEEIGRVSPQDLVFSPQAKDLLPSIPSDILDEMDILFKDTVSFTGDRPYSFDWEHYGCRLTIPKGSIDEGEEGTVVIYGIHSGPFKVPKGMKLVSAVYYIFLSHELLKPATLEILHCCNTIKNDQGQCNLSFLTISDDLKDLKQPYQLSPVNGGRFGSGPEFNSFGFIKRTKFSPYTVAFINWVKYIFGYDVDDPPLEEDIPPQPLPGPPPLDYAVLYCLIATVDSCVWKIVLRLMEYLPFNEKHFLRKERKKSNVVSDTFKKVDLTSNALVIDVSEDNGEPVQWSGSSLTIIDQWELSAASDGQAVKLLTSDIKGHELAPSVEISVIWKGMELDMPTTSQFRVHYLNIKDTYNFPVIVPYPHQYRAQLSSTISSSFEGGFDNEERLIDPPDLRTFMRRVAYKAPSDCHAIALFVLTPDGYRNFKATSTSKNLTINEKYELFYEMWEKEAEEDEMSWSAIIEALEQSCNRSLAKKLQDCY